MKWCECATRPLPQRSVQDLANLYFDSVLQTLQFTQAHEAKHGKLPTIKESERVFQESVQKHGVHRFPSLVYGNSQCHVTLLGRCARSMQFDGPLSSLNPAQRAAVELQFTNACLLDAQLHGTQPITAHAEFGFDLGRVSCAIPQLHCLKG